MKVRFVLLPFLTLFVVFFLLLPFRVEARAFGTECETTTTGGGSSCYVTKTVCKRYFLWIKYDTEVTIDNIDCSHIN